MKPHKERPLTRLLQVTVSKDVYVLLSKLMGHRVEQDYAPNKVTKSAVVSDAIIRLAIHEGLAEEPVPEVPKEPKTAPFEIVPASNQ